MPKKEPLNLNVAVLFKLWYNMDCDTKSGKTQILDLPVRLWDNKSCFGSVFA